MYCVIGDLLYTSRSLTTAEFQWDEDNLRHTAPHKVTPELVGEIADNQPKLIVHSGQGRSGSHKNDRTRQSREVLDDYRPRIAERRLAADHGLGKHEKRNKNLLRASPIDGREQT